MNTPATTMQVPVFAGNGKLRTEQRPIPQIQGENDVLVAVHACGICGTDLNILAQPPAHKATENIIIGHEGIGVVREVGPTAAPHFKAGQRVAIAPRLTCGTCHYCRSGYNNQCTNYTTVGTTRDGAFAPYICLPARALYPLPDSVPEDDALFFEPLSCVVGAVNRPPWRPGNSVVVLGGGPMGMLFALLYQSMGAGSVAVVDISPSRLEFCAALPGITAVDARTQGTAPLSAPIITLEHLRTTLPHGADIVVDAIGNQITTALTLVRRAGHIVLFGLRPHDRPPTSQYAITRYDVTLHGVFVGLNPFVQTAALLAAARIRPGVLITHRLPLARLHEGVELMRTGQAMKVIITMV